MNDSLFKTNFDSIAKKLEIKYNNIDLYYEAFVHPSFANEHNLNFDYERLEFLGDAILDFLVGEYLFKTKSVQEGDLTKIRANYVCEQANMDYTLEMNLNSCLLVGKGAKKQGEDKKPSVLGNLFESFLGALYLDLGMDEARRLLAKYVFCKIEITNETFFVDYKTRLQECIQSERRKDVSYEVIKESGPAHDKTFEIVVKHEGIMLGSGIGKTKKEAEQNAAKEALKILALK